MTQFQDEFLNDQEDILRINYSEDVSLNADPDDDEWLTDDDDDDDDSFDIETGDDVDDDADEELVNPAAIPETASFDDDNDEGSWADEYEGGDDDDELDDTDDDLLSDDEDDDLLSVDDDDDEDEDISSESETTEADTIERSDLDPDFEVRPHVDKRTTGRLIDHEPGTPGFTDPTLGGA
jgi:hypothetical protein